MIYYETISNQDLYLFCTDVSNALKNEFILSKAGDYNKILSKEINKIFRSKVNKTDGSMRTDKENFLFFFDENVEKTGR